jgi:uptake hydrogenase large subunit
VVAVIARCGNAVATRAVARLAELATLLARLGDAADVSGAPPDGAPDDPWVQAFELAPGEGIGAVQSARGLLVHRALLADGRVADYQIVAPTEWNFHPDGALARGLAGLEADGEVTLLRRARIAVQALDPCVPFRVGVGHA